MIPVEGLLLAASLLVLFAIASSKFSARLGLPALVIFLFLGMLAGSEGIGGIEFENYAPANGIGTVALALILFHGGLRTSLDSLRLGWKPALTLATGGVLITSIITGLVAAWVLGLPLLVGVLLGSIVGSTDAAAVFSVLRGKGTALNERLSATLEVESGSNDPMAIFLTIGLLEIILGGVEPGWPLLWLFLVQMTVGGLGGLVVGRLGIEANNRINLDAAGLYPILMGSNRIPGVRAGGLAGRQRVPGGLRGGDRPGQQSHHLQARDPALFGWHGLAGPDRHVHGPGTPQLPAWWTGCLRERAWSPSRSPPPSSRCPPR